jgi:hypothetical protein
MFRFLSHWPANAMRFHPFFQAVQDIVNGWAIFGDWVFIFDKVAGNETQKSNVRNNRLPYDCPVALTKLEGCV